jgi:hypothetical protein
MYSFSHPKKRYIGFPREGYKGDRSKENNTLNLADGREAYRQRMVNSRAPPAQSIISAWWAEIASIGCSALSLTAIVALLLWADGRPVQSWELTLPINSVVAILSILIRVPLAFLIAQCLGQLKWSWFLRKQGSLSGFIAFIDASSGPLGNLTLLSWLRCW